IERQREAARAGERKALLQSLREDLASDDPLRLAWAAHDVGRWRIKELESAVVTALMRAPKRDLGPLRSARLGTSYADSRLEAYDNWLEARGVEDPATDDRKLLHRYVPAALLDALIELDAIVPPEFMDALLLE